MGGMERMNALAAQDVGWRGIMEIGVASLSQKEYMQQLRGRVEILACEDLKLFLCMPPRIHKCPVDTGRFLLGRVRI